MQNHPETGAGRTIGVTLQLGDGRLAVELPADVPIARVVEEVVARYVPPTGNPADADPRNWQLGTTWGRPFSPDSSLAAHGIFDGSVLFLASGRHWAPPVASPDPARQTAQAAAATPAARTEPTPSPGALPTPPEWAPTAPDWAAEPVPAPELGTTNGTATPAPTAMPQPQPAQPAQPAQVLDPRTPASPPEPQTPSAATEPQTPVTVYEPQAPTPLFEPQAPEPAPEAWTHHPGPTLPQQRTRGHLPERTPVGERLRELAAALTGQVWEAPPAEPPDEEAASAGRPISPGSLSVRQAPNPLARARLAWREGSYQWKLEDAISAPHLRRCVTIAVMSPKGGVGKTTVTALLGTMLSMVRHDRVVAIDANPDFGSLGRILTADHDVYVDDLAEVLDDPMLTVTALDQNLGRAAHGLMVLPAPIDPARMERLDDDMYAHVMERLRQMVGVILLDCGTGLYDSAGRAAIDAADQVVLVSDSDPATASLVAGAADLLARRDALIWLVVNKMPRSGARLDLDAFGSHVPDARGLATLPLEASGVQALTSGSFDWNLAPARLRRGVAELANDLIASWPELGVC